MDCLMSVGGRIPLFNVSVGSKTTGPKREAKISENSKVLFLDVDI